MWEKQLLYLNRAHPASGAFHLLFTRAPTSLIWLLTPLSALETKRLMAHVKCQTPTPKFSLWDASTSKSKATTNAVHGITCFCVFGV